MPKQSLNQLHDQLQTGSTAAITTNMYLIIDAIQAASPATQVQAMSLLFLLVNDYYGLDPRQSLERGDAIRREAKRTSDPLMEAALRYIEGELS